MIVVLILAGFAVLTIFTGPQLLGRGHWRIARPRLCLTLWFVLFGAGVVAATAAVGLAIWSGIEARTVVAAGDWIGPTGGTVVAWTSMAVGGGVLSVVGTRIAAMVVAERKLRADFDRLISGAAFRQDSIAGLSVHYVNAQRPVACGLGGARAGEIVISSGLSAQLSAAELRAVIEHERAHLRGRHDLAARVAALGCACLPGLLGPRELQRATRLLSELIADDQASRRCGRTVTASALAKLAAAFDDPIFALRAERLLT